MEFFPLKRNQLNLEKYLKKVENLNLNYLNSKKASIIYGENDDKKAYLSEDSKYDLKQILKNYHLNKANHNNGFIRNQIALLTELLYENNPENYSSKRLFLVNFRKKIIKKNITLSFEDFIKKQSNHEHSKKNHTIEGSMHLTYRKKKLFNNIKYKNKFDLKNKTKKAPFKSDLSSINLYKKHNLRLNLEGATFPKKMENDNIKPLSEANSPGNNVIINNNHLQTINTYTHRKTNDLNKYMWDRNPKDYLLEKNNRIKFVYYLNKKYDFYKNKSYFEIKKLKDIHKRQLLFNNNRINISKRVDFPFKKEFFARLNRLNLGKINKFNSVKY